MIRLIAPDGDRFEAWADALADYADGPMDGSGFPPDAAPARTPEAFTAYLERCRREEDESIPPAPGRVHGSFRWIMEGDRLLGFIALRHELNDFLLRQGGHIGYSVRPSARRRGVATAALRLMLTEAAARGIDPVLVTCEATNAASRRTIERCGGVLENQIDGKLRFWIGEGPRPSAR